jgi:predicted nucleic acid-binding protein
VSGFLLDTNVVSEFARPKPDERVVDWTAGTDESLVFLSVLSLGEIRKGIERLQAGRRRSQLELWLELDLRSRFRDRILPIDEEIADRWGTITALAAAQGRPVPVVDGLLAATAIQHNLTLVTRNGSDFAGTGVPTLNPWIDT